MLRSKVRKERKKKIKWLLKNDICSSSTQHISFTVFKQFKLRSSTFFKVDEMAALFKKTKKIQA